MQFLKSMRHEDSSLRSKMDCPFSYFNVVVANASMNVNGQVRFKELFKFFKSKHFVKLF